MQVPEGWIYKLVSSFVKTTSGGTPSRAKSEYYTGSIPWVTTGELKRKLILNTKEKLTEEAVVKSSAKLLPPNTILMAMYGATIGRLSILGVEATCNQACCAFLPSEDYSRDFLFYYLDFIKADLIKMGSGAGQPNISQQLIKDISILLPP